MPPTNTRDITPEDLTHYHTIYDNNAYLDFQQSLVEVDAPDKTALMNQLTDAALEVCGAVFYCGASKLLGLRLGALADAPHLIDNAAAYLERFTATHEVQTTPAYYAARESIAALRAMGQSEIARQALLTAIQESSDLSGWRGRVTHNLLTAAAHFVQVAQLVSNREQHPSYLAEKLGKGLERLQIAAEDWQEFGQPPESITAILKQLSD